MLKDTAFYWFFLCIRSDLILPLPRFSVRAEAKGPLAGAFLQLTDCEALVRGPELSLAWKKLVVLWGLDY